MENVYINKKYHCKYCDKTFSTIQSRCNHHRLKHFELLTSNNSHLSSENVTQIQEKSDLVNHTNNQTILKQSNNKFLCSYCNKEFKYRQGKWRHEKTCDTKNNKINKINVTNNNLKNAISNSTINSNNKIIQNIYINGFTKENIRVLSLDNIKDIYNQNKNCLIKFIEYINFSEKTPENHTFCNTSLEGNYVSVADEKTKRIQKINKFDCYDMILDTTLNNIDSMLDFIKDKMKPLQYHKFRKLIEDTKMSYLSNKKSKEIYNTQINQMAYNKREMVLNTWKHAVFKDNNIVIEDDTEYDESDDSDSENLFIKGYDLNDKVFDDIEI